jgi:hypothetical protein
MTAWARTAFDDHRDGETVVRGAGLALATAALRGRYTLPLRRGLCSRGCYRAFEVNDL